MPREAKGELRRLAEGWEARVTIQGRERMGLELPFGVHQEAEAEERCQLLAGLARRLRKAGHVADAPALLEMAAITTTPTKLEGVLRAVEALCTVGGTTEAGSSAVTFKDFAERWTNEELHRDWPDYVKVKRSVDDDVERFEKHVYPVVGHVPLVSFGVKHAEAVMRSLPATLSPGSRRHVAQLLHRVLGLAVYPAKIIPANPLPRGFLPSTGPGKALTYLYPDEDAALLASDDVPLAFRVLYGFLDREGMRAGEAEHLRWGDVDLERGAIALDENKTDDPRSWALDPGVRRALQAWHDDRTDTAPEDHVFIDEFGRPIQVDKLAGRFRAHLAKAMVTRQALFEKGPNRRPIRAHDLRATFITVALANGKTEAWVMDRTGHTTSQMLNRYRRAARSFAELGQGDMSPLDQAIPELRGAVPQETPTSTGLPQEYPRSSEPKWRNRQTRRIQNPLLARV